MSFPETALLGAIAGFTIFVGLPVGRMQSVGVRVRVALAMLSVGILAFIFMDVTTHAEGIVAEALSSFKDHHGSFAEVFGLFCVLGAGFTAGVGGISALERRLHVPRNGVRERPSLPPIAGGAGETSAVAIAGGSGEAGAVAANVRAAAAALPGSAVAGALDTPAPRVEVSEESAENAAEAEARRRALRTGMIIAIAIGLHNFAEGLAIGVSASTGAIGLATVLIIGFALHNATEGFGIVGPLGSVKPSWGWLAVAGLVGGGPTFLGTLVGYQVSSSALELLFYALAGGAVLYVVGEIWTSMRRYGHRTLGLYMLAAGFLLGVATDLVVTYGGA